MKNLKRLLSLALAGTILSGMMVMGASAADFTDADEIVNNEAVDTMVALNIINGNDDGTFAPDRVVSRAEMAKMITVALNGGVDPVLGVKTTPTYTDIKGHWAEKYIEYCSGLGIISGRGNGTFDPAGTVTGTEAAKMMLVAMGYDSTVYNFTGADWDLHVNVEANNTQPYKLYDGLNALDPSKGLTRDNAAQIIYNGVQSWMMEKSPSLTITNGEITYQYSNINKNSILSTKYGASVFIGTFIGNYNTNAAGTKGEIEVDGKLDTAEANDPVISAYFPSDFDIANIGEEVKVIYKDGKGGRSGQPDKNDTIYGVFNTGKTTVYNATKAGITGASENDAKTKLTKLKIDGTNRNVSDDGIVVYKNYITGSADATVTTKAQATTRWVDVESVDTVKFVCDDSGKIVAAYEVEYTASKITAVTSSKITVQNAGALDPDDHNIYEDAKKDDVVYFTHYYNATAGKGVYNVFKAETVEGELTGFKKDKNNNLSKIYVDGKDYVVNGHALSTTVTSDAIPDPETKLESTVRVYLVNGLAVAVKVIEESGGSYAVITDKDVGGTLGSKLNGWKATILTTDGEEATYTIHKESTEDGRTTALTAAKVTQGAVIEYSISGDQLKIKNVFAPQTVTDGTQIWNEDDKKFLVSTGTWAVADSNAVLFVQKISSGSPETLSTSFSAHNLRDLGDFNANLIASGSNNVVCIVDKGLVKAAFATLRTVPGGVSADTKRGIVTAYNGTHVVGKNTYTQYTIAVGVDETMNVNIDNTTKDAVIQKGDLVIFDETANNVYTSTSFTKLTVAANGTVSGDNNWAVGAVKEYSGTTLTYGNATSWDATNSVYKITADANIVSETVASDAAIVYVDRANTAYGVDTGIVDFNVNSGKENILFHKNTKGVVDVVFVETGDKGFGATGVFGTGHP